MLINALREVLPVSLRTILIAHTTVNRDDLLELILRELKLEDATMHPAPDLVQDNDFYYVGYNRTSPPTRAGRLYRLKEFVMSEHNAKCPPPLLIVDEAQNLSEEVLEEIRLLTNLELPQCKLLQIILAGQTPLERRLLSPDLRGLGQRISVHGRLHPFGFQETAAYVAHRLRVAGFSHSRLFTPGAIEAIAEASGGIPRLVNTLCEHGLVNAYRVGKREVDTAAATEGIGGIFPEPATVHAISQHAARQPQKSPAPSKANRQADTVEPALSASPSRPLSLISGRQGLSDSAPPVTPPSVAPEPMFGVRVATYVMAREAKVHARQLTELGHDAAAVRAMTPDGRHVTHVMAGVYSDIARAKEVANALREQGLRLPEIIEVDGWTSSGTLHTKLSSKDRYLMQSQPAPPPPRNRLPLTNLRMPSRVRKIGGEEGDEVQLDSPRDN